MATSGQGISFPLGTGSVKDYSHAAQIFRTNDFARAPKNKFLFYVRININPNAKTDKFTSAPNPVGPSELNYLVKSIDMPKFEIEVQDLNQYNRKTIIQKNIKYTPINIKFHDDTIGSLRHFWQSYYAYYYADGSYGNSQYNYLQDDRYKTRKTSRWGFDTGAVAPYLDTIEIYSMARAKFQKITLQGPVISSFNHDNHDYAEGQGLLEATMSVHYTGVSYEEGQDTVFGIPGFGFDNPGTYDTEMSAISGGTPGAQVDFATGQLYDSQITTAVTVQKGFDSNPALSIQTSEYNKNNLQSTALFSNNQLSSVLQNTANLPSNSVNYVFPTMKTAPSSNLDSGALSNVDDIVFSDGVSVPTPATLDMIYPDGSWQRNLLQQGYSADQISAATKYIANQNVSTQNGQPNYQQIAQQFLQNPTSSTVNTTYGQSTVIFSGDAAPNPVYNGFTMDQKLSDLGFTNEDIIAARQYIDNLRVAPGTDLYKLALNYIQASKSVGFSILNSSTTPVATNSSSVATENLSSGTTNVI